VHKHLVDSLASLGLRLLPPATERLWNLNAVTVPEGVDEAVVRRWLLSKEGIEIGAGLGPLAGRVWRLGLMGSGATPQNVDRLVRALPDALDAGRQ
jgi:alanine-glyoxylate transaminase/serine-glyoxylate transaminase/serine-pyruvate transaminase